MKEEQQEQEELQDLGGGTGGSRGGEIHQEAFDFHMNPLAKHWSSSKNHQMKRRRKYNGWFGGERRRDF